MTNRKTCQNIMPDSFPIFAPISLVGGVPECCSNMLAVAKKKDCLWILQYNPSTMENQCFLVQL